MSPQSLERLVRTLCSGNGLRTAALASWPRSHRFGRMQEVTDVVPIKSHGNGFRTESITYMMKLGLSPYVLTPTRHSTRQAFRLPTSVGYRRPRTAGDAAHAHGPSFTTLSYHARGHKPEPICERRKTAALCMPIRIFDPGTWSHSRH